MPSRRKVLLVDDNPDDIALTQRALLKNNMVNELRVVHDGSEAIAILDDMSEELPSIVLLDLKLPKVGGLEVLEHMRSSERTKLVPVVILTSSLEEEDRLKGYGLGANAYVRKPVDFGDFVEAVKHLGMFWLLLNEPPPTPPPAAA
ncbi:MAG: hypothetical protein QOG85_1067 [Gaiellaceae bacterium]|jgi:two-component system response regulator|nr:hypothetical protein [Gaiellaceae bacterium]